jgi:hypothetical protein
MGWRPLLVTTGLREGLPNIPGLADRWGRDVLHCPQYQANNTPAG